MIAAAIVALALASPPSPPERVAIAVESGTLATDGSGIMVVGQGVFLPSESASSLALELRGLQEQNAALSKSRVPHWVAATLFGVGILGGITLGVVATRSSR